MEKEGFTPEVSSLENKLEQADSLLFHHEDGMHGEYLDYMLQLDVARVAAKKG